MSQGRPENRNPENLAAMSEEDLAALRQLHHVIDEEMRKPVEEQDEELISECIETIAEIKGVKGSFSAEEIDEQIAIVKAKAAQEKAARQPKRMNRVVVIAACVALLVAACAVTVYANPTLRAWFMQLRQGGIGATANEQGVTYEYMGDSVIYDSIENLFAAEGISICYPTALPEGVWIKRIVCLDVNGDKIYSITFNTTDISIRVQSGIQNVFEPTNLHETYSNDISTFYISNENNISTAKSIIGQQLYTITVSNYDITNILDSLKENTQ